MATSKITVSINLPWWWRLYTGAVIVSHYLGVIEVDKDVVANFLIRHAKIKVGRVG